MKFATKSIIFISLLMISYSSHAAIIVDTGVPNGTGGGVLNSRSWSAIQFTLDNDYTLTDLEGFISTDMQFNVGSTLTVAIYDNAINIPGSELFNTEILSDRGDAFHHWQGAHDLSFDISSGDYWLAFEVREGQTFSGTMLDSTDFDASINTEAYWSNGNWNESLIFGGHGIRINAEITAVPLPPSFLLFFSGAIILFRTRKSHANSNN